MFYIFFTLQSTISILQTSRMLTKLYIKLTYVLVRTICSIGRGMWKRSLVIPESIRKEGEIWWKIIFTAGWFQLISPCCRGVFSKIWWQPLDVKVFSDIAENGIRVFSYWEVYISCKHAKWLLNNSEKTFIYGELFRKKYTVATIWNAPPFPLYSFVIM